MDNLTSSVFRPEALRRYGGEYDRAVLPRLVSPRTFLALWALLGLLLAAGGGAWAARVPQYASGTAVIVPPERGGPDGGALTAVAFLPPEHLARLRPGQTAFLDLEGPGQRAARPIVAVAPEILGPDAARQRFGADVASFVTRPAAVATVDPAPLPGGSAGAYPGSVYQAEVQVGSRRLLALVGRLFGG
jgi:hypothetical protein